jgi:prevent-host-death family protein
MEKTVNIHTAKTQLSSLIAEAEAGEKIVIARGGKPAVKLVAIKQKAKPAKVERRLDRKPGFLKGKIWIGPDFDDPLPEPILKAFRGEGD